MTRVNFNVQVSIARPGPVFRELWAKREFSRQQLFHSYRLVGNRVRRNHERLSDEALRVMRDAHESVTGMRMHTNDYWLAETMTEAIEAAEALGL